MFKKVLIANRGEIAVRVINALRELEIISVAIFSEPDKESRHVKLADETWKLEGQPARVYLDIPQIIDIAKRAGAEAIHPGYGFLSENPEFAQACADAGIKFIGPKPEVIRAMGSKVEARRTMEKAGVPVVPGTIDPITEPAKVKELGTKYGYPIAIKASAGGGGRGLKVVRKEEEVDNLLAQAQREGASYFGSNEVYVEKYLDHPRHIEVQVIGDEHGNVVHLFERDCSSQRRHQKLLEETPAPELNPSVRKKLLEAAVRGTKALSYSSAGTLEFLVAGDQFYFLEVNTRVQVEHPITEMTTGIDIVKEQIMVALGKKLSVTQEEISQRGHAIECRINAEDPSKNFLPSPGTIKAYAEPRLPWVRVDSACYEGYQVLPFYDSLLAKLVVWGATREEAIARTKLALKDYTIQGVSTTIPFHLAILNDPVFQKGGMHTHYVESTLIKSYMSGACNAPLQASAAAAGATAPAPAPAKERVAERAFEVEVNQRVYQVKVSELVDSGAEAAHRPATPAKAQATPAQPAIAASRTPLGARPTKTNGNGGHPHGAGGEIRASMSGLVKELLVSEGQNVEAGQKLIIFEAMKMESEIVAQKSGKITSVKVKQGETVEASSTLLVVGD